MYYICKQCGKKYKYRTGFITVSYDFNFFCSKKCSNTNKKIKYTHKKCMICGRGFVTMHPRQEFYCKQCREIINKNQVINIIY